jgi:hypothetical protein
MRLLHNPCAKPLEIRAFDFFARFALLKRSGIFAGFGQSWALASPSGRAFAGKHFFSGTDLSVR